MMNITDIRPNITQVSGYSKQEIMRLSLLGLTMICFVFFVLVLILMLSIYFTKIHAREEARYLLFAHMLITDLVYLLFSLFLFLIYFYPITFPVPLCYVLVTVSSTSMKVTPYNLAVMSLERYVAVCFSLRHGEICTLHRTGIAIGIIWTIGLIPNVADLIVLTTSVDKDFFSLYVTCSRTRLTITSMQSSIKLFTYSLTFSLVGLIIIFTYIKITMVAFKIDSGRTSASKAGKTVILHAFQLMLCMTAFSYGILDVVLKDFVVLLPIINFCFFMCLPRFLSPLIYGVRDELFRHHTTRIIFCKN
ncbi:odorant receptor 131-2-like [Pseudophryne corroboree]|uniref:odorant receptor 131-2-like n=1 Tax=Pseudophryne corroboree TaxID=495146 RepID=UPI0030816E30